MATVLVTGANRGIGLELVKGLVGRGDDVIAVCRRPSEALGETGARIEQGIDVTDGGALRRLDERLGDVRLDLLINNAGILRSDGLEELDFDVIREQLEVNSLGPLRVSATLRHRLASGGKIAIVTSRMGSLADNTSGGYYGYRMSKAAVNMAGVSLARDLRKRGIAVIMLHPGYVATEMTDYSGDVEPADAAARLLQRIDELTLETSGTLRHANGEPLPW